MEIEKATRLRFRLMVIGIVLLSVTLGVATWIMIRALQSDRSDAQSLAAYGEVPGDIALVSNAGTPRALSDYRGGLWVVNFIFTRCQATCPLLSNKMAQLQKTLHEEDIRFVSITVDPANDTPEVLDAYAKEYGAIPGRWEFLTGLDSTIRFLSVDVFKLPLMEGTDPKEPIIHSSRLMIVDAAGQIRGYYDALEKDGLSTLVQDVYRLIKES